MKIDWVRKLTSRKFWAAIGSFVTMLIIFFGGAESTATQVTSLIMAGGTVIAYIVGEGMTDAAYNKYEGVEAMPIVPILPDLPSDDQDNNI